MTLDRLLRSACRRAGTCLCGHAELPGRRRRSTERSRIVSSTSVQLFGSPGLQKVTAASTQRHQQINTDRTVTQRNPGTASNQGRYASNSGQLEQPLAPLRLPLPPPQMPPPRPQANENLVAPVSRICFCTISCLNAILRFLVIITLTLLATSCTYHMGKAVNCDGYTIVNQLNTFRKLASELLRFGYRLLVDFIALSHWAANPTVSEPNIVISPISNNQSQCFIPPCSSEEGKDLRLAISKLEKQLTNISQSLIGPTAATQQVDIPALDEEYLTQRLGAKVEARLSELTKQELVKVRATVERLSLEVAANRQLVDGSSLKTEDALQMLTDRLDQLQRQFTSLNQKPSPAAPVIHTTIAAPASPTPEADDLPDFALASAGASVISTRKTRAYGDASSWWQWWWHMPSLPGPSIVLTPTIQLGTCWAFVDFPGRLVVKLSHPIHVSAISIDHLSRQQSYRKSLDSAPRELVIYGLTNGCESTSKSKKLGSYIYAAATGPPTQTFRLTEPTQQVYEYVELVILSNHGSLEYTCIYRFRVHGHMS